MKIIKPLKRMNAEIKAPPSKSYTNRALIISALANGTSVLQKVLNSDDTLYMIKALRKFGIKITRQRNNLIVYGRGGKLRIPDTSIYVGNAGTAMRFLTALASLVRMRVTITGDKRMQERPINDLLTALKQLGINAYSLKGNGFPPVIVKGGSLVGGDVSISGGISSQFLSAIMMICPFAKRRINIGVTGELTSKPYVDITAEVMRNFGATVENQSYRKIEISNNGYFANEYLIDGDASNISYFLASAAITKGYVRITGINPSSAQGDIRFVDVLHKMGCGISKGHDYIELKGNDLSGISIDMNSMPDTVQTLAVVALFAKGKTSIHNVHNLRVKETDRLRALTKELRNLGAGIIELDDGIVITPKKYHGDVIETYNDHRMAMSFAVAGLRIPNIKIKNPECVSKSFPDFWEMFEGMYD